ncbi:MAG: hypothetical protein R3Y64_06615 [Peptostreptococcaceae bacterium]
MAGPLNKIKQTSKTILFEVFNPDITDNLATYLTNEYDDRNTQKFLEHLSKLEVTTFEEFLSKFAPTIYETVVISENGFNMEYHIQKPLNMESREISLVNHGFFKMIQRLYKEKGSSGSNNMNFDYSEIREMLTPEYKQKQLRTNRKNLEYNFKKYESLANDPQKKMERNNAAKKMIEIRKSIINDYNESPINTIPLALNDVEEKLRLVDSSASTTDENIVVENMSDKVSFNFALGYDAEGNLSPIKTEVNLENEESTDNTAVALAKYIGNDFDSQANVAIKSDAMKDMVLSSYVANSSSLVVQSKQDLEFKKDNLQKVYKQSQESFINAISTIVQKLVGVQAFFEHAGVKGVLKVPMIVTNCEISELLDQEEKLKKLIEDLNRTPEQKIWFSILPGLTNSNEEYFVGSSNDEEVDMDNLDSFDMEEEGSSTIPFKASLQTGNRLLNILEKLKVMSFFNLYANENSGFTNMTSSRINEYKDAVSTRKSEYSVFSYPNFTVLPQSQTSVNIGKDNYSQDVYLSIPGVYLDSSYVACAMVVGYQDSKVLESKGFKVNKEFPGVRFDIEKGDNNKLFTTYLNRESQLNLGKDVQDVINEDLFGFCFSSNQIYNKNELINNSFVYLARTMKKCDKTYSPIYRTLTRDLIYQYINTGDKITNKSVKLAIKNDISNWISERDRNPHDANNIFGKDENVEYDSID